jgi:feruloyl-CoA synthase
MHATRLSNVDRWSGPTPPVELRAPFRGITIECETRADASTLVRWPEEICRFERGTASLAAPTTRIVDNVTDWLQVWADEQPDVVFLAERDASGRWAKASYRIARQQILAIGVQLLRRYDGAAGTQGVPLAILSPNSVRQALLTLAALYVGIPVAPISPAYVGASGDFARLRYVFCKIRPTVAYSEVRGWSERALSAIGYAGELLSAADIDAWCALSDERDQERTTSAHRSARAEHLAKVMFTSGSTGSPKGVRITHGMLASAQATSAAVLARRPQAPQVYLEWLPWHHVMGGNINQHRAVRLGASVYLDNGRPVPGKFDETIANLREIAPTFFFNVPFGYALLVPALERDNDLARRFFSRLEYMGFGGASLAPDLIGRMDRLAELHAARPVPIVCGYGATETSGPALGTSWGMQSAGALGLPAPGVTVKLAPAQGQFELRLAGGNILTSYLDEPQATQAAFDDEGFYRTGDAVQWIDAADPLQGLRYCGRISEDFKLTSGTWVNAGIFRTRVIAAFSPVVRDAVITGQDRDHVAAMAFVDETACRAICKSDGTVEDLVAHPALLGWLRERLRAFNRDAGGSSERLERILLLAEPPDADAFEITDKGYINQRAVIERRSAVVDSLYAVRVPRGVVCATEEVR